MSDKLTSDEAIRYISDLGAVSIRMAQFVVEAIRERDQLKSWEVSARRILIDIRKGGLIPAHYNRTHARLVELIGPDDWRRHFDDLVHAQSRPLPLDEDDNSPSDLDYDPPPEHCGGTIEDGRPINWRRAVQLTWPRWAREAWAKGWLCYRKPPQTGDTRG